jgi:DNA-directed RNA polymerase
MRQAKSRHSSQFQLAEHDVYGTVEIWGAGWAEFPEEEFMSADVVRETLKNEAELLDQMIKFVKDVKGDSFTRQAKVIQESWARFLGERKESSEQLSKASDEELLQDLQQELAQVE